MLVALFVFVLPSKANTYYFVTDGGFSAEKLPNKGMPYRNRFRCRPLGHGVAHRVKYTFFW